MDILELGAIGELVGGVAVLATLLYLALQVRHSNRLAQLDLGQLPAEHGQMADLVGGAGQFLAELVEQWSVGFRHDRLCRPMCLPFAKPSRSRIA